MDVEDWIGMKFDPKGEADIEALNVVRVAYYKYMDDSSLIRASYYTHVSWFEQRVTKWVSR